MMEIEARARVLHLINGEHYAGAERVQDLLAQGLDPLGFSVEFIALKDGVFAEKRLSRDAPLRLMPMSSRADLGVCRRIARVVRERDVRLVHSHTPRTALLGALACRLASVPMVHHVHSPTERDTEQRLRNTRNALAERWSLQRAVRLIAVSGSINSHLRDRGYREERIREVPNGVPTSGRRRREYRCGEEFVIGTLALYRPRKGVEILLEAVQQLRAAGVPVRLHAVGPFESLAYEQSVKSLAHRMELQEAIDWAGFRSDIGAEFEHMHVFALPSLYGEGMPMVVLEAMAAGLPVVSTLVEGIPQLVRDGCEGLLVQPGNATGLAAALRQFVAGEADAAVMGDNGWRRQRQYFSDRSMAAGVASIYREVLGT